MESRDRQIRRVLLVEGACNLTVMVAKASVGISTGSVAVLSDAIHSLADLANNGVALLAARAAAAPPDREHPYGHQKFETLAVFGLATLLAVLGIEIALRGLAREAPEVARHPWGLATMLGVLGVNTGLALWQGRWARRLESDLLLADSRHTLSDVLTTAAVIVGWQIAAAGYPWLDTLVAFVIAGLVLFLAFGLFRRAIPVLTDQAAADPDAVARAAESVPGVRSASRVRSQSAGTGCRIDLTVTVDPDLSTRDAHAIADAIEERLRDRFQSGDVTVHVEPGA